MSELEAAGHSGHVEDHIERLAAKDGFPWHNPPFLPKTHRALTLGELARDRGEDAHWAMHQAIFTAYFGEMRDIGSEEVLLDIAAAHGFDGPGVTEGMGRGRFRRAAASVPARRHAHGNRLDSRCTHLQRAPHRLASVSGPQGFDRPVSRDCREHRGRGSDHIGRNRDCAPFLEYHSCGYSSTSTTYQGRGGR